MSNLLCKPRNRYVLNFTISALVKGTLGIAVKNATFYQIVSNQYHVIIRIKDLQKGLCLIENNMGSKGTGILKIKIDQAQAIVGFGSAKYIPKNVCVEKYG